MKPAAELRQGSTYRKDNIPYLILKAERHQSTSGKRQRAAEVKFKTKELISGKIQEISGRLSASLCRLWRAGRNNGGGNTLIHY